MEKPSLFVAFQRLHFRNIEKLPPPHLFLDEKETMGKEELPVEIVYG